MSPERIPQVRDRPRSGFSIFSIALEIPTRDMFPSGIPHNGRLQANSTDSLLRVWSRITRMEIQTVDANPTSGVAGSGDWVQVGRNALPLFNAGLIGAMRQTLYLHSDPSKSPTASRATSSPSTRPSIRAFRTAGALAADLPRTAIR